MTALDYLITHKDITSLSNFRTPAMAEYYFEVKDYTDVDKVSSIVRFANSNKIDILFIGAGTNILFSFILFKGVVVKNYLKGWTYNTATQLLEASSMDFISHIAESLENDYNQPLWHRFIGLPGSVGGAVFGNAGCFGLEIENNFVESEVLDVTTGEILIFSKEKMDFSYRSSLLKKESGTYLVLRSRFDLSKKIEKYHSEVDNLYFREHKQPSGNTCGSFFKNPVVDIECFWKEFPALYNERLKVISAGFLLESSGLKGYRHGGAFFSHQHANFLMSDGTATSDDMKSIIVHAQNTVSKKFGIHIENEVQII